MDSSRAHAEVLRDTIRRIEQNTDLGPDDPDLRELKRILLQKITAIELGDAQAPNLRATGNPPARVVEPG
jgi:hypothetical protein